MADQPKCIRTTEFWQPRNCLQTKLDGCIVWNAHSTLLGEEVFLIYIVLVCYVKTGRYGKTE